MVPRKLFLALGTSEVIKGDCVYSDWGSVGKDNACMHLCILGNEAMPRFKYQYIRLTKNFACPWLLL